MKGAKGALIPHVGGSGGLLRGIQGQEVEGGMRGGRVDLGKAWTNWYTLYEDPVTFSQTDRAYTGLFFIFYILRVALWSS